MRLNGVNRRKKGTSKMYQINIVSGDSHCVFKGRMKLEVGPTSASALPPPPSYLAASFCLQLCLLLLVS